MQLARLHPVKPTHNRARMSDHFVIVTVLTMGLAASADAAPARTTRNKHETAVRNNVPEQAWLAVEGKDITVLLTDASQIRGRLYSHDDATATLIEPDGTVTVIAKDTATKVIITELARSPSDSPSPITSTPKDADETSLSGEYSAPTETRMQDTWNAVALLDTARYGLTSYVPRAGGGIRYGRRIRGHHWIQLSGSVLLDYGDWQTFRLEDCGLGTSSLTCGRGLVAGVDLRTAWYYQHKFQRRPKVAIGGRVGIATGWWKLPEVSGTRLQSRMSSWMFGMFGGMDFRYAPAKFLALGFDVDILMGFTRSKQAALAQPIETVDEFLLAFEIEPFVLEFKF